jgi:hypothetical protein
LNKFPYFNLSNRFRQVFLFLVEKLTLQSVLFEILLVLCSFVLGSKLIGKGKRMSIQKKNSKPKKNHSVADIIIQRNLFSSPKIQIVRPEHPVVDFIPNTDLEIKEQNRKEMIFKEAKENRDYYLNRQFENQNKMPWFRYVRKESQYSEFVMLTANMANQLLNNIWTENDGNRKIKIDLKEAYKRDIENERWVPSDESIGVDYNGIVYNGRHRLTAMSEINKEWPFYITFNALEEAKFTVDSGAKRNSAEKLRLIIDAKLGNRTTGFCKCIMNGLQNKQRYTETEVAEFAHKWEELILWVSNHLPLMKAEIQASIAKAYIWYGPEKIEPFCRRFRELRFNEDGDPARALYLVVQKAKNKVNQAFSVYKKTLTAIEFVLNDKKLYRVCEKNQDIFYWEENWEVPQGSWWQRNKGK